MLSIMHLTASTFYGGPERQMLGLARALEATAQSRFWLFQERGLCRAFLGAAAKAGFEAAALRHDTPRYGASIRELGALIGRARPDVLVCHGYKAGLLGGVAARMRGVPVVAVSRGWTGECPRVRLYDFLDKVNLRWMDRVVCVSQGQAAKVRRAGVPSGKIVVINNAVDTGRFRISDPQARAELEGLFQRPVRRIVGALGRLSPEKGFDVLVKAAAIATRSAPDLGFILVGDGFLRDAISRQIEASGLMDRVVLAGFRADADRLLPFFDLVVQSSHTEGMPNVVLEACAAGVPVVATAVGGTPEILADDSGVLVPPGDAASLADAILRLLADDPRRADLAERGRRRVEQQFTFQSQSNAYMRLFNELGISKDAG